jgi:NADP-dependent 3-hydroxy acid dehydrogenase YdfG
MSLEGKVVAITGASSGIGEAAASYPASRGAKLVLGARGKDKLQAVAARIVTEGGTAAFRRTDVTRREDLISLVEVAAERFGALDVLIGNAGVMPIGPLDEFAVDDWMQMIDVNVKGVLHGIAAALPLFLRQGHGQFIHTASTAARKIVPGQAVYAGTKAAVAAISDGLRQETIGRIRVTVIYPGFTATEFASHVRRADLRAQMERSRDMAMPPDAVARAMAYAIEQPDGVNVGEIVVRPRCRRAIKEGHELPATLQHVARTRWSREVFKRTWSSRHTNAVRHLHVPFCP